MRIEGIQVRAVAAPMKRPLATSTGAISVAPLLLIDLRTDGGIVGRSYLFAIGMHNLGPIAALVEAMAEMVEGDPVAPFDLEKKLRQRYTLLGVHNIVLFAMAGIDMTAWDACAQALGQPLAPLLGTARRSVPAYNSKGLGLLPLGALGKEARELAGEGLGAVKLRMGRAKAAEDLEALRIVKEEPVRADDFAGCARIARAIATPIQIGENFMGPEQMAQALAAQACDFVMPDAQRIGGVTGWMRAAALAQGAGLEMSSHLFPEVSVHLLAATPTCHWLEYVDWADAILAEPVRIEKGEAIVPDRPGSGIAWDEKAVQRYAA